MTSTSCALTIFALRSPQSVLLSCRKRGLRSVAEDLRRSRPVLHLLPSCMQASKASALVVYELVMLVTDADQREAMLGLFG